MGGTRSQGKRRIETPMEVVRQLQQESGEAVRQFQELR